jgi:hypothetical protein
MAGLMGANGAGETQVSQGMAERGHLEMVQPFQEAGEIVITSLHVMKGEFILATGLVDDQENGDEFEQPILLVKLRPIEKRPGVVATAIHGEVVIGQPEMKGDGTHHRMKNSSGMLPLTKAHISSIRSGSSTASGGA